jgi:prepilin-type processing-associated H-X9-DG protein
MDEVYHPGMGTGSDGLCWVSARVRFEDIRDGLTNTLAFTESVRGPCDTPPTAGADVQLYRGQVAMGAPGGINAAVLSAEAGVAFSGSWDSTRLSIWLRGCSPAGPVMNGRFVPNSSIPDLTSGSAKATAARSRHPGGVNACFSDGSVRFIASSVERDTWHALWTRAGGEVTSGY